jgi:hypothetical protein
LVFYGLPGYALGKKMDDAEAVELVAGSNTPSYIDSDPLRWLKEKQGRAWRWSGQIEFGFYHGRDVGLDHAVKTPKGIEGVADGGAA